MSKAFTKESDGADDLDDVEESWGGLQPHEKNYMTPAGARKFQDELRNLLQVERPKVTETVAWAAGNGDRSENADYTYGKRRLREIDKRVRFLTKRLDALQVVDPTTLKGDQVYFGSTVTIRDEEDREKTYSIVGIDEVEVSKGKISWKSPLGAALMKARVGDYVQFRTPKGVQEIEVVRIQNIAVAE